MLKGHNKHVLTQSLFSFQLRSFSEELHNHNLVQRVTKSRCENVTNSVTIHTYLCSLQG